MLTLENLYAGYADIQVLRGISLEVPEKSIVALIGPNGAGKTTTLKTIMGMLKPIQGQVSFAGKVITRKSPHEIVSAGLYLVPEWRGTFSTLNVLENLELGAFPPRARRSSGAPAPPNRTRRTPPQPPARPRRRPASSGRRLEVRHGSAASRSILGRGLGT